MAIALLASLSEATGNNCTAIRIRDFLQDAGETVELINVNAHPNAAAFELWEQERGLPFRGYIGIHAHRAGRLLIGGERKRNFVIIFGGTDLNEHVYQPKKLQTMQRVCELATSLVCFSEQMKNRAEQFFSTVDKAKFRIIYPSIIPPKTIQAQTALKKYLQQRANGSQWNSFREYLGIDETRPLYILPCGIRSVKDPAFLVNSFQQDVTPDSPYLLIIGPVLDDHCFQDLSSQITNTGHVQIHPPVPQQVLHGAFLECDGVVNTSTSEGVCNVILEAMHLQVVIFARRNQGNSSVVQHLHNGILFDTPQEFHSYAHLLSTDAEKKRQIIQQATEHVQSHHSDAVECQEYQQLLDLFPNGCSPE